MKSCVENAKLRLSIREMVFFRCPAHINLFLWSPRDVQKTVPIFDAGYSSYESSIYPFYRSYATAQSLIYMDAEVLQHFSAAGRWYDQEALSTLWHKFGDVFLNGFTAHSPSL